MIDVKNLINTCCIFCFIGPWYSRLFELSHLGVSRVSAPPVCISLYLLLASHNQTDRTGVPAHLPCFRQTSKGVLTNEVAISYCSLKHVRECMYVCVCQSEGERQVNGGIRLLERKKRAERQVGSVAAAQLIVQVLFIRRFSRNDLELQGGEKKKETEAVRDGGVKMGSCFAFRIIPRNKTFSNHRQMIPNADELLLALAWRGYFFLLTFQMFYN